MSPDRYPLDRFVAPVDDLGFYRTIKTNIPSTRKRLDGKEGGTLWIAVQPLMFGAAAIVVSGLPGETAREAFEEGYDDVFDYLGANQAIEAAEAWAERLERVAAVAIAGSEPDGWYRHKASRRRRREVRPSDGPLTCRTCQQAILPGTRATFTEPAGTGGPDDGPTVEHTEAADCMKELEGDAAAAAVSRAFEQIQQGGPRGGRIPEGD